MHRAWLSLSITQGPAMRKSRPAPTWTGPISKELLTRAILNDRPAKLPGVRYPVWLLDHSHSARSSVRSGVGAGKLLCGLTMLLSARRLQKSRYSS